MKYYLHIIFLNAPYMAAFLNALSNTGYKIHMELFTNDPIDTVLSYDDPAYTPDIIKIASSQGATLIQEMPYA